MKAHERTTVTDDGVAYNLALTDPQWAAWNVRNSLGIGDRREVGDARLVPFTFTPKESAIDRLKSELSAQRGGRWCPPGDYVMLQLRGERITYPGVDESQGHEWMTMMSDTPDEANDHAEAIWRAYYADRILIHGLGLGCYLHTVLACSDATLVDVVEISEDVINLVGPHFQPYVDEGRLTIHHGNCLTYKWPPNTWWDVVWHDVWQHISDNNLRGAQDAEHGVSYETMLRKFGRRCSWQGAWGLEQARHMRVVERSLDHKAAVFTFEWNGSSDPDVRVRLLADATCPRGTDPAAWRDVVKAIPDQEGGALADQYRERASRKMTFDEARLIVGGDV